MSDSDPSHPSASQLSDQNPGDKAPSAGQAGYCERNPYLVFVVPLVVYLLSGTLESLLPKPPDAPETMTAATADAQADVDAGGQPAAERSTAAGATDSAPETGMLGLTRAAYPLVYSLRLALTLGAMALALPGYREFPCRVSLLALGVGVVGVVIWVGLCELQLEQALLGSLGLGDWLGARVAYNPLAELSDYPLGKYLFLAVRLIGLVLIVPVIEEFFLRGCLMRFVIDETWWRVPFGALTRTAVMVGAIYGPLTHPAEMLAAAVWFSLVTWLMHHTRNLWDCVLAHAVTNALLAAYVLTFSAWRLW